MKKSLQILSLIMVLLFAVSCLAITVCYAEEEVGGAVDGGGGDVGGGDVGGGDVGGGDVGGGDVGGGDVGGGDVGGGDVGGGDAGGGNSGGSGTGTDSGSSGGGSGAGTTVDTDDYSGSGSGYEEEDNSGYSNDQYYDPDPISYGNTAEGGNSDSEEQVIKSDSVASGSNTIKSSGISAEDVKPNEWSAITLNKDTKNEQNSSPANFKQIKENKSSGDDSFWMLYLGYALLVLAGLGILYFIVATIAHRSAVKRAERLERRRSGYTAQEAQPYYEPNEGYREQPVARKSGGSRHAADVTGSSRRTAKADTGEVYVPRRAAKRTR